MIDPLSTLAHRDKRLLSGPELSDSEKKVYFELDKRQCIYDFLFLFSLSLAGLQFPLGNILVVIFLIRAWQRDKEGFLFMLFVTFGAYGLTNGKWWGISLMSIVMPFSLYGMLFIKKPGIIKATVTWCVLYTIATVAQSFLSDDTMAHQAGVLMKYVSFCSFVIPLLAYSGEAFYIHKFWNRAFSLQFIICIFYIIDAYVIRGWILVPALYIDGENISTITNLIAFGPFGPVVRKYPQGLFPLVILIYPIAKYYRLSIWQWAVIILSIVSSQTFTYMTGFCIGYILAMGNLKKILLYGGVAVSVFTFLYFVDDAMGYTDDDNEQSTLRIASSLNQFIDIGSAEDEEDISQAGSGRLAQAIPKINMLYQQDREWIGFGFIPLDTKDPRFLVVNEYFRDISKNVTACTHVEIEAVYVFLVLGYIGLIIHCIFIYGLWRIIRRINRYADYFKNVLIVMIWLGFAGFAGWHQETGILLSALTYGVIILANKPLSMEKYPDEWPKKEPLDYFNR